MHNKRSKGTAYFAHSICSRFVPCVHIKYAKYAAPEHDAKLPSYRVTELPSYRVTELPSYPQRIEYI